MPMEATPLEHVVVALATYFTGLVTVDPLAGLETVTVANALEAKMSRRASGKQRGLMRLTPDCYQT